MATQALKNVIFRPQNWIINNKPICSHIRPYCSVHQQENVTTESKTERPHMLHAVWRVRGLVRRPYTERKLCWKLGLDKRFQAKIHKNTPQVNILLRKIQHLIRVKPVILKDGIPEKEDFENCQLKWNGELIIKKKLEPTSSSQSVQHSLTDGSNK
ncbi:large ribosomal subunit protein uL30m-like [Antedon mediterranea]|uniref:large ribosomal subunit protein uL30m-like n=1 Tax=Antedon mediterranea TaxID=105859 RepID=UPI003AF801CF